MLQFSYFFLILRALVRKEIRDLSKEEWQKYKKAVIMARDQGFIDEISELHESMELYAHANCRFLPWHRMLLLHFESILQKLTGDRSITVPYWDWTIDSEDPIESIIFTKSYWGEDFEVNYPDRHPVGRNTDHIDAFYSKVHIQRLLKKSIPYDEFREILEMVPHAIVHFNLGGDDGDMSMMYSPNDPIFWHHHSFIDYIWQQKQEMGLKSEYNSKLSGKVANELENLVPFNKRVIEVLDNRSINIEYDPYHSVKIFKLGKKPSTLPEKYMRRHHYDIKRVRRHEYFLINGRQKPNVIVQFLIFLGIIRY